MAMLANVFGSVLPPLLLIAAIVLLIRRPSRDAGLFARWLRAQVIVLGAGGYTFGPLLLYGYFEGEPRGDFAMLMIGVWVTAAVVLVPLLWAKFSAWSASETTALEQTGLWTLAQITSVTDTLRFVNERPVAKVTLHIAGPGFVFDSQASVAVTPAKQGNLNAGKLVVLVDPTTRRRRIDWEKSSLVNGLSPAQFTVAEDHKTYDLTGRAGPLMEIMRILKPSDSPLDRKIDLPPDPVLRQQVVAVIRRAAARQPQAARVVAATAPAVGAPAVTPPQPSIAQRLQELETLRATGAISDAEYTVKRERLIDQI
jgi:hypothetical protein